MGEITRRAVLCCTLLLLAGPARGGPDAPVVRVLARGGVPVPQTNVWVDQGAGWKRVGVTDASGVVALAGVPTTGTARVAENEEPKIGTADLDRDAVPITSVETVIRVPHAIRRAAEFVDGRNGKALSVPWTTHPGFRPLSVAARVERFSLDSLLLPLQFKAPEGWGTDVPTEEWAEAPGPTEVSRTATDVRVLQPLRPEAVIAASVTGSDGKVLPALVEWSWPGRGSWRRARRVGDSLRGVPWYPSEPMDLRASPTGDARAAFSPATVRLRLPATPTQRVQAKFVLTPRDEDGASGDDSMGFGESLGEGRFAPSADGGSIAVTMRARDGSPLGGTVVYVRDLGYARGVEGTSADVYLDERGRAELRSLRAGEYSVESRHGGVLPLRGTVTVRAGEAATVDLQESPGGTLVVRAVDAAGKPLPYAALSLVTASDRDAVFFDERDGVQRLDSYTDLDGRRRLERVEAGRITVSATWGARHGEAAADIAAGVTTEVRITLPDTR